MMNPEAMKAIKLSLAITMVIGFVFLAFVDACIIYSQTPSKKTSAAYSYPPTSLHLAALRHVSFSFGSGCSAFLVLNDINDLTALWTFAPDHPIPSLMWSWVDDSPVKVNIRTEDESTYWTDRK